MYFIALQLHFHVFIRKNYQAFKIIFGPAVFVGGPIYFEQFVHFKENNVLLHLKVVLFVRNYLIFCLH